MPSAPLPFAHMTLFERVAFLCWFYRDAPARNAIPVTLSDLRALAPLVEYQAATAVPASVDDRASAVHLITAYVAAGDTALLLAELDAEQIRQLARTYHTETHEQVCALRG